MEGKLTGDNIHPFVFAGKAIFTLENPATANRFTYKVKKHDEKDLWFVSLLSGPDNTHDYTYVGTVFADGTFHRTKASKIGENTKSFQAINWFFNKVKANPPETVNVYHAGRCGRCGKLLTVPSSIENGFGPECLGKVFG